MCIDVYFSKRLCSIPSLGIFLWHEGITPEYKGLYSPFWALLNEDYDKLGWSFLQMNKHIDAGPIYAQGKVKDIDIRNDFYGYIRHKAVVDSLQEIEQLLIKIENHTAEPINCNRRKSGYYSYIGFSDALKYIFKKYFK